MVNAIASLRGRTNSAITTNQRIANRTDQNQRAGRQSGGDDATSAACRDEDAKKTTVNSVSLSTLFA